jgi:hypothetical protein
VNQLVNAARASGRRSLLVRAVLGLLARLLSMCVPKRPGSWVVLAPYGAGFTENAKYLTRALSRGTAEASSSSDGGAGSRGVARTLTYVSESEALTSQLREVGVDAVTWPGRRAYLVVLRAEVVVFSTRLNDAGMPIVANLAYGSTRVQLWHGTGLKRLGLLGTWNQWARRSPLRSLAFELAGEKTLFDLLVVNSMHLHRDRLDFLSYRMCVQAGSPKAEALLELDRVDELDPIAAMGVDLAARERLQASSARWKALWAPTRNASSADLVPAWSLADLDRVAREGGGEFYVKLHYLDAAEVESTDACAHVHLIDPHTDVYPLLPFFDVLVTDYSSLFADYLLTSGAIIFSRPPKGRDDRDRQRFHDLVFDFPPGPVVRSLADLQQALDRIVDEPDWYALERKWFCDYAQPQTDGASIGRIIRAAEGCGAAEASDPSS